MRDLTAAFIAQLEAQSKMVALFFEGDFANGTVYLWSGLGEIDWDGKTWVGFGGVLAGISRIKETSDTKAEGIAITLSGITETMRSLILAECEQGKPGSVFVGFIDDNGDVVADPSNAFEGRLDVPSMVDDGKQINVTITYENRLRDLERVRELRYTDASQQEIFPGDVGFEYVPSLQDWNGTWGRP